MRKWSVRCLEKIVSGCARTAPVLPPNYRDARTVMIQNANGIATNNSNPYTHPVGQGVQEGTRPYDALFIREERDNLDPFSGSQITCIILCRRTLFFVYIVPFLPFIVSSQ